MEKIIKRLSEIELELGNISEWLKKNDGNESYFGHKLSAAFQIVRSSRISLEAAQNERLESSRAISRFNENQIVQMSKVMNWALEKIHGRKDDGRDNKGT